MTPSTQHNLQSLNWVQEIIIRPARNEDLKSLEWEGAYIQYRKIYQRTFQKSCEGKTLMWVADFPNFGIVAQVFIQEQIRLIYMPFGLGLPFAIRDWE
jgi:hypothetical protein